MPCTPSPWVEAKPSTAGSIRMRERSSVRADITQLVDDRLLKVEQGLVELVLPYSDKVTQQQDGFHGGAMGAVADIAGGYAALTMERDVGVPSVHVEVDYKAPLRYGDVALIDVIVEKLGAKSVTFRHEISRERDGAPNDLGARAD